MSPQLRPPLDRLTANRRLLALGGGVVVALAVVAVANRAKAQAFLHRVGGPAASTTYQGVQITNYNNVAAAFVGRYLVIAPVASIRAAVDVHAGRAPSLARASAFRRAESGLPA